MNYISHFLSSNFSVYNSLEIKNLVPIAIGTIAIGTISIGMEIIFNVFQKGFISHLNSSGGLVSFVRGGSFRQEYHSKTKTSSLLKSMRKYRDLLFMHEYCTNTWHQINKRPAMIRKNQQTPWL